MTSGECFITQEEIEDAPVAATNDQLLLSLLRDKGAPVKGSLTLKLDDSFLFQRINHSNRRVIEFKWRLI